MFLRLRHFFKELLSRKESCTINMTVPVFDTNLSPVKTVAENFDTEWGGDARRLDNIYYDCQ